MVCVKCDEEATCLLTLTKPKKDEDIVFVWGLCEHHATIIRSVMDYPPKETEIPEAFTKAFEEE